ncbi:MAG: Bor/Iss family lipoprotein [Bacteriovoracaceae bacterium]
MLVRSLLISLLTTFLLTGCSAIHYRSKNSIPLDFKHNPDHKHFVKVKGKQEFFLGGFIPHHQDVFVDEEVYKAGYQTLSKLEVEDHHRFVNYLIAIVTLGFYTPRDYVITGYTTE